MKPKLRNLAFSGLLGLAALLGGGGAVAIGHWIREWRMAVAELARLELANRHWTAVSPPPTPAGTAAITAGIESARRRRAELEPALSGRAVEVVRNPLRNASITRTGAYAEIAAFQAAMRRLAELHGVEIGPEAGAFGFSAFAHEAPEPDRIRAVQQQRLLLEVVIVSLLESGPRLLQSVQRQPVRLGPEESPRPSGAESSGSVRTASSRGGRNVASGSRDDFEPDPRRSARWPGTLETTALRVVFLGETRTLRKYLNRLVALELPILVRDVAVEPVDPGKVSEPRAAAVLPWAGPAREWRASLVLTEVGAESLSSEEKSDLGSVALKPVISRPLSRFTVTLEYVEVVAPHLAPEPESGPGAAGA